jgi:hypothetical protein
MERHLFLFETEDRADFNFQRDARLIVKADIDFEKKIITKSDRRFIYRPEVELDKMHGIFNTVSVDHKLKGSKKLIIKLLGLVQYANNIQYMKEDVNV